MPQQPSSLVVNNANNLNHHHHPSVSIATHSFVPSILPSVTNSNSANYGNIQINPNINPTTTIVPSPNHQLCYCAHCCPQPVVSAITPAVILSRYTEINLCDSFALHNQNSASPSDGILNNCSTSVFMNNPNNNIITNTAIINNINHINNLNNNNLSNQLNNNNIINNNNSSIAVSIPYNCKEIMVRLATPCAYTKPLIQKIMPTTTTTTTVYYQNFYHHQPNTNSNNQHTTTTTTTANALNAINAAAAANHNNNNAMFVHYNLNTNVCDNFKQVVVNPGHMATIDCTNSGRSHILLNPSAATNYTSSTFSSPTICSMATSFYPCNKV